MNRKSLSIAHLIVAVLVERCVAAAVPAPRVQQAVAFACQLGLHECSELLHLVPVTHTLKQSAA
jgi:hypothetical protein